MLHKFKWIGGVFLGLSLVGCASASKNTEYMSGKDYRSKPVLTSSLTEGIKPLTDADIKKLLSSRISFPKRINLAILRVSSAGNLDFQTVDRETAKRFYEKSNWGSRVQSVYPVPQMMVTHPVSLASLRQTAALLQADAMVIIRPTSVSDWQFKILEKNKAKGITSLEVLVLDTRTGTVPYTAIVTETAEISEKESDYSKEEFQRRAQKASETKALLQVAPDVKAFLTRL